MKSLLLGIVLIVILGFGGLIYRNAVEHANRPITCPLDALVCPDGTSVARVGSACVFPSCLPPNVSLSELSIAFAVPAGFVAVTPNEAGRVAEYEILDGHSVSSASIVVHRYPIAASSTAFATIQETAIGGASGVPVSPTRFTSIEIGTRRFTVVGVERFEATIHTAYYLSRGGDVLRFDAIDRGVLDWMEPDLDVNTLPAHVALKKLLTTLQGS